MKVQNALLICTLLGGCGARHVDHRASNQGLPKKNMTHTAEGKDYGVINISNGDALPYENDVKFKIMVNLDGDLNGNCAYDQQSNRTMLKLVAGVQNSATKGDYAVYTGNGEVDHPPLYAPGNLCMVTSPYDYHEAPIFISRRAVGGDLQIGRFRKNSTEGAATTTLPILCEQEYAGLCHVTFGSVMISEKELAESTRINAAPNFSGSVWLEVFDLKKYLAFNNKEQ